MDNLELPLLCHGFEGPCSNINARTYRQNTSYREEKLNWITLCPACAKANDEYWDNMHNEYYQAVISPQYNAREYITEYYSTRIC
jgi:hypothetical protein